MPPLILKDRDLNMNAVSLNTRGPRSLGPRNAALALGVMVGLGLAGMAIAQDASQLGKTLTPVGAGASCGVQQSEQYSRLLLVTARDRHSRHSIRVRLALLWS